jgi:tetratricopeptide (TPR) repeat protein
MNISTAYFDMGRIDKAIPSAEAAIALLRETSNRYVEVRANLAEAYLRLGRFADAMTTATAAIELNEQAGNRTEHAHARAVLGDALDATGDPVLAREHWLAALAAYEELGDPRAAVIRLKVG